MDQLRELFANLRDLPALIKWAGYFGLTAIVFAETGLLVGFFLPGDSLLVTAGLVRARGMINVYWLGLLLTVAADPVTRGLRDRPHDRPATFHS